MRLFLLSLLVHVIGLTLAAGTTFLSYFVNRNVWQLYNSNKAKALAAMSLGARFPRFTGIGIGLSLLSGIFMLYFSNGAFAGQVWLKIKIVLVLVLIANGFIGQYLHKKMKIIISGDTNVNGLQQKLTAFYYTQICLFLTIFVLGVFKFN